MYGISLPFQFQLPFKSIRKEEIEVSLLVVHHSDGLWSCSTSLKNLTICDSGRTMHEAIKNSMNTMMKYYLDKKTQKLIPTEIIMDKYERQIQN